jgi:2-polyprenyl-6-methoxyphenol hydroxylase-like FAD-dependent oxidoreductase
MLAERGWRVLLIEKSAWPREKVCGGCLTAAAAGAFREIGIDAAIQEAQPIDSVFWHAGGAALELSIPGEMGLLRADLDGAVVSEAVRRGCEFLPGVSASLLPASAGDSFRSLKLQFSDRMETIRAGVVLACDGISGTFLAGETWAKWSVARNAWIGVAATYESGPWPIRPGAIHMHVGKSGYVGLVCLPSRRLHMAAALDPVACRRAGGPEALVREILRSCGRAIPTGSESPRFRGTGVLTRRRKNFGGHRVLAVGDACGYVEPFTGEGMAWAATGARQIVQMLPSPRQAWPADLPERWKRDHHRLIGRQQHWSRALRPMMHHPAVLTVGIAVGSAMPAIANWIAAHVSQPRQKEMRHDSIGRYGFPKTPGEIIHNHSGHRNGDPDGRVAGADT